MSVLALGGYGSALGRVELGNDGFGPPVDAASAEAPSFVLASPDGRFVYAALEGDAGRVGAWATEDPWRPMGEQPTGGAAPCHLVLSPDGRWLVTANYTSGSICVHPVLDDGSLGVRTDLVQHHGDPGPHAERQDGPHAHQSVFVEATGLLVCDLGLDVVVGYELDASGRLREVARSALPPGSGPRHLVVAGDVAYVLGELASSITVCRLDGLELTPTTTVSLRAEGATGENTAAAVVLAGDEVLASNRGDDTVCVLTRSGDGLQVSETLRTGGSWPRWMGLVDGRLLVADERSDLVTLFARGAQGWERVDAVAWPAPTCAATLS